MKTLVLASKSSARAMILNNAGLSFTCEKAEINERALEAPLLEANVSADDVAAVLAEAKAHDISRHHADTIIIGADQTMTLSDSIETGNAGIGNMETRRFHKPETMEEARRQLLVLQGKTHSLHSALCCVKNGETLFRYISRADLTMRPFSPEFIGRYLSLTGKTALQSVGCYQLEGPGIQLFEKISGDYFTILGLPLLPLLSFLREMKAIDQ